MWVGAHWGFVIFNLLLAFNSKIVDTLDVWRRLVSRIITFSAWCRTQYRTSYNDHGEPHDVSIHPITGNIVGCRESSIGRKDLITENMTRRK